VLVALRRITTVVAIWPRDHHIRWTAIQCSICMLFTCYYCRRKSVVYESPRDLQSTA